MADQIPTSEHSAFDVLSRDLLHSVDAALPRLRAIPSGRASQPQAPRKWSPTQVIGHLIDSAANNHQRFVRAQQDTTLTFPGYTQEHWVNVQRYDTCAWNDVLDLWSAYNRHLAHVIAQIPEHHRKVACTIGSAAPVTLGFLVHDYNVHLRHHLAQVGAAG
jgi:hypothetical protein